MIDNCLTLPPPWSAEYLHGVPADGERLSAWMAQEHLVRTWQQDWPPERWTRELDGHAARPDVGAFVIHREGGPFAYVEVYEIRTSALAAHENWADGDLGFHIAVIDPARLRRGLGTGLVHDLCETLFRQYPGVTRLGVEPNIENKAIARVLELNGFALVRPVRLAHKVAAMMALPRPSAR